MKQLRILGRSIRDAFKSVFRNFSLSMASISCITITLLIVAISMVLSYNIENISTLIKKDFSIVVFVENNATDEDIKNIKGNCFLGIDAGSTTTKAALIDEDCNLVYTYYSSNEGSPLQKINTK